MSLDHTICIDVSWQANNIKRHLCCHTVSTNVQVSVRILGGLMALGYEIGTIMKRNSIIHSDDRLTIKLDTIEGMGTGFVQVHISLSLSLSKSP